jgi:lauroyl/myristoyl acyltransferase
MGRIKLTGAAVFYLACRAMASLLPAGVTYAFLLPYGLVRGLRPARTDTTQPVARLPTAPADKRPGFLTRWRFHAAMHHRWLMLFWSDRWHKPRWKSRFTAEGAEIIDRVAKERPIVIITVHTGSMIVLGGWLMSRGLGVGSVIVSRQLWERTLRAQQSRLVGGRWSPFSESQAFLRGDARSMVRYLKPGRCMFLPADHVRGRVVVGAWPGGRLRLANGAFRLARLANAVVMPVIVTEAGRWKYNVHVGEPVPQALIDAEDDVAAANHVASQLMPIAVSRPGEAAVTLIEAALPPD